MVNRRVRPKKIAPNTQELMEGKIGITPISKVVAAVRGIARKGPMHNTIKELIMTEGTLPNFPVIPFIETSPVLIIAKIATNAKPTSAIKKQINPVNHSVPALMPK